MIWLFHLHYVFGLGYILYSYILLQSRLDIAIKRSYKSFILFPDKFIYILLPIYHVQNNNSLKKTSNFIFISNFEKKKVSKSSTNNSWYFRFLYSENAFNLYSSMLVNIDAIWCIIYILQFYSLSLIEFQGAVVYVDVFDFGEKNMCKLSPFCILAYLNSSKNKMFTIYME